MPTRPVIGITCDTVAPHERDAAQQWRYESHCTYAQAIAKAGGVPILLPFEVGCVERYLAMCDGFLLSGGDDPDTERFGEPTHAMAKVLRPARQAFELELMRALAATGHPVLGVCLGMQWMALMAGGRLHQHLPEAPGFDAQRAAAHDDRPHAIRLIVGSHPDLPAGGVVHSRHHQAVADPGTMRAVAISDDGVIEAIDSGGAPGSGDRWYLGVQWHPERTEDEALGAGLIRRFVAACGGISTPLP